MEDYDLFKASREVQSFSIYELSNWYIRRNRRRFWKGEKDKEKISAYQTLRETLLNVISMMASACPFISETLYQRLRTEIMPESIHLLDMPEAKSELIDSDLERKMDIAQRIVFLARSLRERSKLRVRQPLRRILVPVMSPAQRRDIQYFEDIIIEELNIKGIDYVTGEADIVRRSAKPNFKTIGKKFGKNTQKVAAAIKALTNEQIKEIERATKLALNLDGEQFEIAYDDVEIQSEDIEGWLVESEGGLTVALDTQLSPELISEGLAREFVNRIQNLRKQSGFEVTDRITIELETPPNYAEAIIAQKSYIANETLADEITFKKVENGAVVNIDEDKLFIKLKKN